VEAGFLLIVACVAYEKLFSHDWTLFALFFLVPDIALLAYATGRGSVAASLYNLVHTDAIPLLLGLFAFEAHHDLAGKLSLIWISHISFDRMIGYGLKFPSYFRYTHIQNAATTNGAPANAQ
jgi:hypothetical protein